MDTWRLLSQGNRCRELLLSDVLTRELALFKFAIDKKPDRGISASLSRLNI